MASPTSSIVAALSPASNGSVTNADIVNLYSQLQSTIEPVPGPPSLPPDFGHSPPETRVSAKDAAVGCPCQLVLKDTDTSGRCSICHRLIPAVDRFHQIQSALKDAERRETDLQARHDMLVRSIYKKDEMVSSLQHDISILNEKYVNEIEKASEIQHAKSLVERELEDLSQQLFEEANGMVATEKKEKYHLELQQKRLVKELENTRDRLAAQDMQLQALRKIIREQQEEEQHQHQQHLDVRENDKHQDPDNQQREHQHQQQQQQYQQRPANDADWTAGHDLVDLFYNQIRLSVKGAARKPEQTITGVDTMLLDEFKLFVEQSAALHLKKLSSLPFLKACIEEDVLPCLQFGPNSRLSSRKLVDAILFNTCFIEETPPGFAEAQARSIRESEIPPRISSMKLNLWERFSATTSEVGPFVGCQACGRPPNDSSAPLAYRVRTTYYDDWACIDRFCRDRLVAVCEFYTFIRNVHQGYYTARSISDLYHEAMRLRLQMFYARLGVLPWMLRCLGLKEDSYGEAQLPSIRTPSPLPKDHGE